MWSLAFILNGQNIIDPECEPSAPCPNSVPLQKLVYPKEGEERGRRHSVVLEQTQGRNYRWENR